jgi:Icc-related predicted phosphoesterase
MAVLTIFFATDIHGSETCFRKFLNAGKVYHADVLIMGGDITGKMIIPIVELSGGTYTYQWLGSPYNIGRDDLSSHMKEIRLAGCYPYITNQEEMQHLEEQPQVIRQIFRQVLRTSVRDWLALAAERLDGTGIECYITPGNDDDLSIDETFLGQNVVINPEKKVVALRGEIEMISSGYSNHTPWNSPREMDEDQLWEVIQELAGQLSNPGKAIFNFHCPPYNSGLDTAARLDKTLKPITGIGGVQMGPVGSTAVLKAIKIYRPMLGLHGHVHESRGAIQIGQTLCVNPGSEYSEGILRGCLLMIEKGKIRNYLLTSG